MSGQAGRQHAGARPLFPMPQASPSFSVHVCDGSVAVAPCCCLLWTTYLAGKAHALPPVAGRVTPDPTDELAEVIKNLKTQQATATIQVRHGHRQAGRCMDGWR